MCKLRIQHALLYVEHLQQNDVTCSLVSKLTMKPLSDILQKLEDMAESALLPEWECQCRWHAPPCFKTALKEKIREMFGKKTRKGLFSPGPSKIASNSLYSRLTSLNASRNLSPT